MRTLLYYTTPSDENKNKNKVTDHFVSICFRHWCGSNLQVKFLPNHWHVTNWLRAERAWIPDAESNTKSAHILQ